MVPERIESRFLNINQFGNTLRNIQSSNTFGTLTKEDPEDIDADCE